MMSEGKQSAGTTVSMLEHGELLAMLQQVTIFADLKESDLECFADAQLVEMLPGELVIHQGEPNKYFWIMLEGALRAYQKRSDGTLMLLSERVAPETFGEVPLLAGTSSAVAVEMSQPAKLIRLDEEGFWRMMVTCPHVRRSILGNMAQRFQGLQSMTIQREKLASLGTLAAGLMHELNNPGSAAKRAASQLRENLTRLQQLSLRFSKHELKPEQMECLIQLQQQAFEAQKPRVMNTLEQSDAEDALAQWLDAHSIENAWQLAPTLVSIGLDAQQLECAQFAFQGMLLSDSLNWLGSLVSSVQLVGTVEESITRVTDLVMAVKKYAYEDKGQKQTVDVNDSIYSTLVIMAYKFRHKEIQIDKNFTPDLPPLKTRGTGLNQVWTNLLDNAIDAVAPKGHISLKTWLDNNEICVSIKDDGTGIPTECQSHIFEPFYTTKPVGVGTGLGLDIAHRIVVSQYGGYIGFKTDENGTEFTVRLPLEKGHE
ncbi:MAG: ATP-binding protein [Acidobacteriaceae bacterium]